MMIHGMRKLYSPIATIQALLLTFILKIGNLTLGYVEMMTITEALP